MTIKLDSSTPIARKQHRCEWCGEEIKKGEKHYKFVGIHDGFCSWRMHSECIKAFEREVDNLNEDGEFMPYEHKRGKTEDEVIVQ